MLCSSSLHLEAGGGHEFFEDGSEFGVGLVAQLLLDSD